MITHIRTKGFKGFDLDEDIPKKVIYTGKNMSGKSTRAGAIAIALYGQIPFSTAGKKLNDILDSFGGKELVCAATVNGAEFGRKISRNDEGKVSQVLQIDKKRQSKENFAIMLNKAGSPRIADVAEFMKQSEAKKVETLFDLFPNPDLANIDTEIENAKADVSRLQKKKEGAESTVQRLVQSKNEIQLPAGNIAETEDAINKIEIQIVELEQQIKDAEIEQSKQDEADRIERERQENKNKTPEEIEQEYIDGDCNFDSMPDSPAMQEIDQTITSMEKQVDDFKAGFISTPEPFQSTLQTDVRNSINRIIEAMTQTGCTACAALIVAKQELKKYD